MTCRINKFPAVNSNVSVGIIVERCLLVSKPSRTMLPFKICKWVKEKVKETIDEVADLCRNLG